MVKWRQRENGVNKTGFTLLEVTLFLAIASFLSIIAVIGLAPRIRNVRFTGAVRDLEKNLVAQFTGQTSGQNTRTNIASCTVSGSMIVVSSPTGSSIVPGAANNCVINGLVAVIDRDAPDRITYRQIVSLRLPNGTCSLSGFDKIESCHEATILNGTPAGSVNTYNYINGLEQTPALANSLGAGYVQDPNGTAIYQFQLSSTAASLPAGALAGLNPNTAENASFNVCYGLGGRQAKFSFTNRSLKPNVMINEGCAA